MMNSARTSITLSVLATALAAGCASQPPVAPVAMPAFDAAEVGWSMANGTGTVEGTARVGILGRPAQTCAGGEAQLVPTSPFAVAMMRGVFGNPDRGYVTVASSPAYPKEMPAAFGGTVRRVGCGPNGEFRFDRVPAGSYFVFANVVWREGNDEPTPRGGSLLRRVQVSEGAVQKVVLEP